MNYSLGFLRPALTQAFGCVRMAFTYQNLPHELLGAFLGLFFPFALFSTFHLFTIESISVTPLNIGVEGADYRRSFRGYAPALLITLLGTFG